MLIGALALIAVSGVFMGQRNAEYVWAAGGSVVVQLVGDTASIVRTRGYLDADGNVAANSGLRSVDSVWAHDTTGFSAAVPAPYECCWFKGSARIADTTRPIFVLGATRVTLKLLSSDTAASFTTHLAGLQFSDDSTNWQAVTTGSIDGTFQVFVDTTGTSLSQMGNFRATNSGGGNRRVTVFPVEGDIASADIPTSNNRIDTKYMRAIFGRTLSSDDAGYPPSAPFHTLRVRAYVQRDELGEKLAQTVQGP